MKKRSSGWDDDDEKDAWGRNQWGGYTPYKSRIEEQAELLKSTEAVILIRPKDRQKMETWIDLADGEVGGLGKISKIEGAGKKAKYLIESVELLPQEASAAQVQLDSIAIMDWMHKNHPGWRTATEKPAIYFWHSHVNMAVNWSGQDEHAIESLTAMGGVVASVVGNKRREYNARLDFEIPVLKNQITIKAEFKEAKMQWLSQEELKELEMEFYEKVTDKKLIYGIEKDIEDLEKTAQGTDRIAEAARVKLEKLKKQRVNVTPVTKVDHGPGYSHGYGHGGHGGKYKMREKTECSKCEKELAEYERGLGVCWGCRRESYN